MLSEERAAHAPDPQHTRYGQGRPEVVVQAVIGGPAFRGRPWVDVYWHEGLRPMRMRMTPGEARRIGEMLMRASGHAERRDDAFGESRGATGPAS